MKNPLELGPQSLPPAGELAKPKKASHRRGPLCRCQAYPWPHRPSGGACRWPDAPAATWKGVAGKSKPSGMRIDRGIKKRLARWMGWHVVRDRAFIKRWLPKLYVAYCRRRGYPGADEWLRHHGLGRISAMRVTAYGFDSKSERAPCGTGDLIGSGRARDSRGRRPRVEDYDAWRVRPRLARVSVSRGAQTICRS